MLTEEQAEDLREQLLEQIKNFPEDKRKVAEEKILSMSNEELEEFLNQNQAIAQQQTEKGEKQCIFCSIAEGKIPSHKIAENKKEIAVLEINPIGKGHTLVIPKKHGETTKLSSSSFSLAKKIAEKIKLKLKPLEIKITTSNMLGHSLIEVIPFYKDTDPSKRKKAEEKDLLEIQQLLYFVKKEKKPKVKKEIEKQKEKTSGLGLPKIKSRIP